MTTTQFNMNTVNRAELKSQLESMVLEQTVFGFLRNRVLFIYKSQSALTRAVNAAIKEFGANKNGEPKKCGAYGQMNYNNIHLFFPAI